MTQVDETPASASLARLGLRLSDWFERWFPDAFALALIAVVVVFLASVAAGASVFEAAQWFGAGFWDLTAFTLQVAMIIVTGYAVATSPPVFAIISRLADVPRQPRTAMAFVALFSMLSSLLSWSFSLIFSALLAREVGRRIRGADYRALGAAAYVGAGSVWALGLSSSAALIMSASSSLPDSIERISGVIPLRQTIGLWQSQASALILIVVSMAIAYYSTPGERDARSIEDMGVTVPDTKTVARRPTRPGEWLEHSPALTILVGSFGAWFVYAIVSPISSPSTLAMATMSPGPASCTFSVLLPCTSSRWPTRSVCPLRRFTTLWLCWILPAITRMKLRCPTNLSFTTLNTCPTNSSCSVG